MPKESSGSVSTACSNRAGTWTIALILALVASPAYAEDAQAPSEVDVKAACARAYEGAQVQRSEGRWLDARVSFRACAQQECPSLVRTDCGRWLQDLEEVMPSIVVQATADGAEIFDVRVMIDGQKVKDRLDGKAIAADPGPHTLRYEAAGFAPIEAKIVIREGEQFRPIAVAFRAATPAAPRTVRPVPSSVWIASGAALVATGSFVGWGLAGRARRQELETSCAPFCEPGAIDAVRTRYVVADVSLAIAALSLGAAAFFYFTRPEAPVKIGAVASPFGVSLGIAGELR